MANQEDLARLMTTEQGKPLAESRGEVGLRRVLPRMVRRGSQARLRRHHSRPPGGQADRRHQAADRRRRVHHAVELSARHDHAQGRPGASPPAAPSCSSRRRRRRSPRWRSPSWRERAGVPEGRVQRHHGIGRRDRRRADVESDVRKLSFTGSTAVGKLLMAQCAGTVKKLSLELGGNAPFIVFDDADLDAAVEGAMASKYRNTRPDVCVRESDSRAGRRLRRVRREARRGRAAAEARAGSRGRRARRGRSSTTARWRRSRSTSPTRCARARASLVGGHRHALGGRFFEPTVLVDVTPTMLIAREETFGPVAPLFRFKTDEEAIALANDTEFGLAAYFYGRDIARVWRVAEALEYGMVGINTGIDLDRGRAVRRRQGIRPRPRGLEVRHRGIRRSAVPLLWRNQLAIGFARPCCYVRAAQRPVNSSILMR